MDSQFPLYFVFEKERADLPHRSAGSVHAPDAEMALENARDVFVRRPECLSLWVVPADAVYSKTVEELQDDALRASTADASAPGIPHDAVEFLVFQKQGQTARETFVAHVGSVTADSPQAALARALEQFDAKNVFVWWIVPATAVIRSEEGDAPSMFEPAHAKKYRNHLSYPVEPIMRELKSAQEMLGNDE